MAALAGDKQVFADDHAFMFIDFLHIVYAMTVYADRFVSFLTLNLLFEDHGRAVEIRDIAIKDIGADAILSH